MANVLVQESSLSAIAEAIRSKTGGSEQYTPAQMGPAISGLSTGTEPVLGEKTITEAGTFYAEDDGLDGYSSAVVSRTAYLPAYVFDGMGAYVKEGQFVPSNGTTEFYDIYLVESGHRYYVSLGGTVGTRFRVLYTEQDPTTATEAMSGTVLSNVTNPDPYSVVEKWIAPGDGYLTVYKDDAGTTGLRSYVFDTTVPEGG